SEVSSARWVLPGRCRHGGAMAGKELAADGRPGVSVIISVVSKPALERRTGAGILGETRADVWIGDCRRNVYAAVEVFVRRSRSGPIVAADIAAVALGPARGTSGETCRMVVCGLLRWGVLFHVWT